jgi:hypothetical protein
VSKKGNTGIVVARELSSEAAISPDLDAKDQSG